YLGDAHSVQVRLPPQPGEAALVGSRIVDIVSTPDNRATVLQIDSVGSQVGDELYAQSLMAMAFAMLMMMAYIAVRYRWKFSVGAVISL
ncbi:protein translocase subunit SecF, partial [Acinetobacter baumannii]